MKKKREFDSLPFLDAGRPASVEQLEEDVKQETNQPRQVKSYEVLRGYFDDTRERRSVRITTCLTPSVHERLKKIAADSHDSVNNIINMVVEQYIERLDS